MKFLLIIISFISLLSLLSCSTPLTSARKSTKFAKDGKNQKPGDQFHIPVVKEVLGNGLTVLLVENNYLPIFSYYTFYKVGSKYETKGITGSSHYLEHMMFKGTPKYKAGEFDKIIAANGGNNNAYTNRDLTVYYENMPKAGMDEIIAVEADRMQNLLLQKKAFESERQVVLNERKLRYENKPSGQLYYALMEEVFAKTPYQHSPIGDIEDIKTVTRDQMMEYFKTFYAPNAAIIVIVGDFNARTVMSKIKQAYSEIPRSQKFDDVVAKKDQEYLYHHRAEYNREIKIHGASPNPMFYFAFRGEPMGTRKSYVMDILSSVIGGGKSTYLQQEFVVGNKPQLTYVYAANYNLKNNGTFIVAGELLGGKSLKRFKQRMQKNFKRICEKSINDRSVQKTKNQFFLSYFSELQTNAGVASFIGSREAYLGDYAIYKKESEIYEGITTEEVMEVCKDIFYKDGKSLFISVWNKHPKKKG